MGRRKSKSKKRWDIAKILTLLGGLISLGGFLYAFVLTILNISGSDLVSLIWNVIGIIISILVLVQIDVIKIKINIPFNWWMLLILVCLQAIMLNLTAFVSIAGLGVLLEAIAVIFLLLNVL